MSAPTLWEEGTMRAGRVIRWAALACGLVVVADVAVLHRLGAPFDVGFVVICVAGAIAVRPGEFFGVAMMPPFLLLGWVLVLAAWHPVAVAHADDGLGQALVSGLAHHSGALFAGYVNTLVVLGVRHRIRGIRRDRLERRRSPYYVGPDPVVETAQENRSGSPRPTLVTSGVPSERSTTVVGSESVSPPSRTASSF